MKIFISDIDKQNARSVALKNIARYFRVPDWEFKSNNELQKELDNIRNPEANAIIPLLKKYFSAYDKWFNFYQKKRAIEKQQESEYELNNKEKQELQELINSRQTALAELQNKFDTFKPKIQSK